MQGRTEFLLLHSVHRRWCGRFGANKPQVDDADTATMTRGLCYASSGG